MWSLYPELGADAEMKPASDRMVFNWVLWRYTILYINERSWESGGVVRAPVRVSRPCAVSYMPWCGLEGPQAPVAKRVVPACALE